MRLRSLSRVAILLSFQSLVVFGSPFAQTNLVSNVPGLAANLDPDLRNPWGVSHSATSPFWISNQVSNNSVLYNSSIVKQGLIVSVPPTAPPPTGPTGQVNNSFGAGNFVENGAPASFIFATLAGSIDAWNSSNGTTASIVASTPGAVYTGLAIGTNGTANFLYAANFAGGRIDVFNSSFAPTTPSGSFTDPNLPTGYVPYNIQNVGGKLYVQYAQVDPITHEAAEGAGLGVVNVFDTNGNFLQRIHAGGPLNAPWGIAVAPAGFGEFGGDILVGNFGDGTINAFDPITGDFLGALKDSSGNPIVNDGLWALDFRAPGSGFDPNTLFITAGINDESDGLFAQIQAVPEPAAMAFVALGLLGLAGIARRRRSAN
jgi:uncharacterized protein (TIGR03118 family)